MNNKKLLDENETCGWKFKNEIPDLERTCKECNILFSGKASYGLCYGCSLIPELEQRIKDDWQELLYQQKEFLKRKND